MKIAQRIKIGDVCSFLNGGTPSKSVERYFQGNNPWITGADITSPVVTKARSYITNEAIEGSATNLVPSGTVLLVTRTSVGKVAIAGIDLCFSQDITALTPDTSRLHAPYLVEFLKTQESHFESQARGATIKGITRQVVEELEIPLPPLEEQKRIAAVLDKAALAQLDSLTQSIFLEMFGDPVTNPKGWQRIPFCDLLENIDSGWSPNCLDRPVMNKEWGILKLGAVTWCEYDPTENKALPPNVEPDTTIEVKRGDLLFARKNTRELVAACALVRETPPRLLMSDLIFRLRLRQNAKVESCFLHQLLVYPTKRRDIQKLAGGSAGSMPNISKARLQTTLIEVPPIKLQQEFARRVTAVEKLKAIHSTSLTELDTLFASLQHRAFRGEL